MRRILGLFLLALALCVGRSEAITATLQYPAGGSTEYGGSQYQPLMVLSTDVNATCKFDASNVAYASMSHYFQATGGWTWHQTYTDDVTDGSKTYYYACKDDGSSSTTTATSVTFTVDSTVNGSHALNVGGHAISDTRIMVQFTDPNSSTTERYRIYRNGTQILDSVSFPGVLDTGLTADTTYTYTAAIVQGGVEQALSGGLPIHTLVANHATSSTSTVLKLEDFENGILELDPGTGNFLFSNYPSCGSGALPWLCDGTTTTPTVSPAKDGTHAAMVHMIDTNCTPIQFQPCAPQTPYFQMAPFGLDGTRHFVTEYIKSGSWTNNTYNRMRVWMKFPSGWVGATGGGETMEFGTYVRTSHAHSTGQSAEESGVAGAHFYHNFNAPRTDLWYQVILDTHPAHSRGDDSNFEYHDRTYFSGEPGWTYMDALGRFYIDTATDANLSTIAYPSDFYFDDFEFFHEDESLSNIDHVFSICGGYDTSSHTVSVCWSHPKDDNTTKADVVYAFSDIYALGFANATTFPGTSGGVSPQGAAGVYNVMTVNSNAITTSGHSLIYVGIKTQGDTGFRQIAIPLSDGAGIGPGANLRLRIRGDQR